VVFDLVEPASDSAPVIPVQPLVLGQASTSTMARCT
jgi:hypothetical protein